MKSSRAILQITFVTTLICFILLIILYFFSDMKCILFVFIKDIVLAVFSGSFMTIIFSYIQMKIYEQELIAKFQNVLIKIINVCNIQYRDKENYRENKVCEQAYNEFVRVRNEIFLMTIDLREIYYFVNIKTKNINVISIQKCVKYIIRLLKDIDQYFVNFNKPDEWEDWEKEKLLQFNNILWYEIEYPDSEEEIQKLAEKTDYLLCGQTLIYSRVFYDIMKIYPLLNKIYRMDI